MRDMHSKREKNKEEIRGNPGSRCQKVKALGLNQSSIISSLADG